MRVAIVEPEPRVCGPVIAERHLRRGFEQLGHHCDVVTSTKSGKPRVSWGDTRYGAGWCPIPPEVCVKDADLAACLDSYDVVVLIEPRNPREDKRAVKEYVCPACEVKGAHDTSRCPAPPRPAYVAACRSVIDKGKPFATCLHGTDYDPKTAPYFEDLVLPNSTHVTFSQRSVKSMPVEWQSVTWLPTGLPYTPVHALNDDIPPPNVCGTMGRVTPNKGPHVAMAAAMRFTSCFSRHEMWGASSIGMAGNPTFDIWKMVKAWGGYGTRHGNDPESENGGDIIRPYVWEADVDWLRGGDGMRIEYKGNYMNPVQVAERLTCVVAMTNGNFSGGLTEFVSLEAMDAGAVPIVGPSTYEPDKYKVVCVDAFTVHPGIAAVSALDKGRKGPEVLTLLEATGEALETVGRLNTRQRMQVADYNRWQLIKHNSPMKVAAVFLEAAFA